MVLMVLRSFGDCGCCLNFEVEEARQLRSLCAQIFTVVVVNWTYPDIFTWYWSKRWTSLKMCVISYGPKAIFVVIHTWGRRELVCKSGFNRTCFHYEYLLGVKTTIETTHVYVGFCFEVFWLFDYRRVILPALWTQHAFQGTCPVWKARKMGGAQPAALSQKRGRDLVEGKLQRRGVSGGGRAVRCREFNPCFVKRGCSPLLGGGRIYYIITP